MAVPPGSVDQGLGPDPLYRATHPHTWWSVTSTRSATCAAVNCSTVCCPSAGVVASVSGSRYPNTPETGAESDSREAPESGYAVAAGRTFHRVLGGDENDDLVLAKRTKLANFATRIVAEMVIDDGAEAAGALTVAVVKPGAAPRTACVPVEPFAALDWVVKEFGPTFVTYLVNGKREHLRCAIREPGGDDIPPPRYARTPDRARSPGAVPAR